jgi:hypothetical protein
VIHVKAQKDYALVPNMDPENGHLFVGNAPPPPEMGIEGDICMKPDTTDVMVKFGGKWQPAPMFNLDDFDELN